MSFLNKTGVALRLVAGALVMGMTAGCFFIYATHEGDGFFGTPPDYMDTFLTLAGVTLLPLVVQWVLFYIVTGSLRILPRSK